MSFYQYHYDKTIFSKLPFIGELVEYVYHNTAKDYKKGFLCAVKEEDYIKIKVQLEGDKKTPATIVAKDKVYVLPKCSIPTFKLKEYLKSVGATQTVDIKDATKIIGHEGIESVHSYSNSALVRTLRSYYNFNDLKEYKNTYYKPFQKNLDEIVSFVKNVRIPELETQPETVIVDYMFHPVLGHHLMSGHQRFFITPTCAMILYYKMLNKIPVVSEESVFAAIQKHLVIDKDVYESLTNMLGSKDQSNRTTAIEIISNCDIEKSWYYLWRLIKDYDQVMADFRRNKNFRLFREKVGFEMMSCRTERTIIPFLESKGVLTPEIYQELIGEVVKTFQRISSTELFDITLTPGSKYKKYAPEASFHISVTEPSVPLIP